jgi:glutamate racemase
MSSELPVGVFDSGIGGLSILAKIHQLLPHESLIYVADSAHAPYGPKGDAFIIERSRHIMDFFLSHQAKAVVVACNTATAAAVKILREEYTLPIIGMEPAIKPAAEKTKSGIIGVLATEGTLASDKFVDLKSRFDGQVEFITQPCPGLVEEIEKLEHDSLSINRLLHQYISPLLEKGADTLVLGCTHYSFITGHIRKVAGDKIAIVDTDDAVARRLASVLEEKELLADSGNPIRFYSSGELGYQVQQISRCWGADVEVQPFL